MAPAEVEHGGTSAANGKAAPVERDWLPRGQG